MFLQFIFIGITIGYIIYSQIHKQRSNQQQFEKSFKSWNIIEFKRRNKEYRVKQRFIRNSNISKLILKNNKKISNIMVEQVRINKINREDE